MKSLIILFISLNNFCNTQAQQLELLEGETCEGGWICSTVENCSALGNLQTSRPKICSFTDANKPILCCPPSSPFATSKAAEICRKYQINECRSLTMPSNIMKREAKLGGFETIHSVVGGHLVAPRTHRHMALIGYGEMSSVEWLCGGSIISNNFILSAAHCAESPKRQIARWVRVGDLDISSSNDDARPATVGISQRIIHPDYKDPSMYNDIVLFRLEKALIFNAWVGPACLATQAELPQSHATVTGWGRTDFVGDLSSHLLAVDVSLVNANECKQLLGTSRRIPNGINTSSMICAGETEGGKDACSGDSGGPLVVNSTTSCLKTQIGIISFGRMCALPNSPGVYTKIYHYLPWIQSIVWP